MIYILLIAVILIGLHIYMSYSIMINLCRIMIRVDRVYDIVNKWAIYKELKQEECHIDNEKE